jgi:hypothetical protein
MTKRDWRLDSLHKYKRYEQELEARIPELEKFEEAFNLMNAGIARSHAAKQTGIGEERLRRMWPELHTDAHSRPGNCSRRLSKERLDQVEVMLDDGASFREIMRTMPIGYVSLRKYFPGRGWTQQQAGQFSVMIQRMGKVLQ